MKKSITSLELAALINELQGLMGGKISQIYHSEEEVIFQIHSKEGKKWLRIIPGKFLNLTKTKEKQLKPSSFCMQLRKYLDNALIKGIEQKETERITIFELEKREKYYLIAELFSPGNLVLTDEKEKAIACLHQQRFKDRFIKPGERYVFPPATDNWKKLGESKLQERLKKSQKKIVVCLATEIGLGGVYAEEICKRGGIEKNKPAGEIDEEEIKRIIKEIKNFIKLIEKPSGFIYEEQITPFALEGEKEKEKKETYNEAIDTLKPNLAASPYEKKIMTLKKIVEEQEETIKKQEERSELNSKKAEEIYGHYQPIKKLLEIVQEMRESKAWGEIEKELKKERKIKRIDLKEKKVVLEL